MWVEETRLDGERLRQLVQTADGGLYAVGKHLWKRTAVGWTAPATPVSGPWRAADSSGDSLWLVGAGGRALLWEDGDWRAFSVPASRIELVDVCAWKGAAWAAAAGSEIWRWEGQEWSDWRPEVLARRVVGPMWGAGPDDVWIGAPEKRRGAPPEVLHWDGAAWSAHPLGDRSGLVTAIDGRAADDLWATGYENKAFGKRPLVSHWDGRSWTRLDVPLSGSVGSVHAGEQTWLLGGQSQALVGGPKGWRPIAYGDYTLTRVYAPPGSPARAIADGRILLVGTDEAGIPGSLDAS